MSRDGLQVTVIGWAASTPREVVGDGVAFTSFRLATTPRWYDSRQGTWTDGRTEWITVKAFREAAFTIAASVHKGQPVIAHGRLRTEEWVGENGPRTTLVLDATAVGHDLTRGTARFARREQVGGEGSGSAGGDGPGAAAGPADEVDPWSTDAAEVDPARGDEPAGDPAGDPADDRAAVLTP